MSLVDDQVRRLDAALDRIQLAQATGSAQPSEPDTTADTTISESVQATAESVQAASPTDTIHVAKLKTVRLLRLYCPPNCGTDCGAAYSFVVDHNRFKTTAEEEETSRIDSWNCT